MAIAQQLKEILDSEKISYEILRHAEAYTAMEIAGALRMPGKVVAKTVIVKADGQTVMCVLPATHMLDFEKFKKIVNAEKVELMHEGEIARLFPQFEVGAEPPFGHLSQMVVYVDKHLAENEEILINAGTHTDIVKLSWNDFLKLANPIIGDFGRHI